jgi:protein O-GlcNAc transferase
LPLVTCRGRSFVARVAATVLHAAGLPELVTDNLADYESCALKLAADAQVMQSVRRRLAANRGTCPLFDVGRYRRHIEAAYITMWEKLQRGEPPQSFSVNSDFMSRSVAHLG